MPETSRLLVSHRIHILWLCLSICPSIHKKQQRLCVVSQLALQLVDESNVSLLSAVLGGTSINLLLPCVVLRLALW